MLSYEAASAASTDTAWDLMARPSRWSEWAPQLRGAWSLGDPEVELGARGAARLVGVVPVPAVVVAKDPGRSWTWRVGPVELEHRVEPRGTGCVVAVDLRAPAPLEALLRVTYGPVVAVLVRRLARVAERDAARGPSAS
jgi:hypothetical protein